MARMVFCCLNGYGRKHNHGSKFGRWKGVFDVIQYDSDRLVEDWDWGNVRLQVGVRLRDTEEESSFNIAGKLLVRWDYHFSVKREQCKQIETTTSFVKKRNAFLRGQ